MRVVCVDASPGREYGEWFDRLVKGKIYTVRKSGDFDYGGNGIAYSFWLEEVQRSKDSPYAAWRFRPLDETRLDQFRVHLKTVPKRVEERV